MVLRDSEAATRRYSGDALLPCSRDRYHSIWVHVAAVGYCMVFEGGHWVSEVLPGKAEVSTCMRVFSKSVNPRWALGTNSALRSTV